MKRNLLLLLLLSLTTLLLISGCGASADDLMASVTASPIQVENDPVPDEYRNAVSAFAWDLLRTTDEGNRLLSPVSVHLALSMTMNGAEGDTFTQMSDRLAGTADLLQLHNKSARLALSNWNRPAGETRLSIANSIWFDNGFEPRQEFLQSNADHYTAAARRIDFRDPGAVRTINKWVDDATRGLIPTILDTIPEDAVMYLVNAVHFKGDWAVPFSPDDTQTGPFSAPGVVAEAAFMHRTGSIALVREADATAVLLPYVGDRYGFFALLPDDDVLPDAWLAEQDNDALAALLAGLTDQEPDGTVTLALPRFETEYKDSLKDELIQLDMALAFDPDYADFSRMGNTQIGNLYIGDVLHKTFCRVDEKGTEAAAVTAVEMRTTSMPDPGIIVRLDRPFVYGIVDTQTGMPLFLGIMENPAG